MKSGSTSSATLDEWLDWLLERDPDRIEPGVTRTRRLAHDLLGGAPKATVIAVAGTNGKGSSAAMAASICRAAGYRVGSYTSPHLNDVRERFWLDGEQVAADRLLAAFERIDAHPQSVALTYFEWLTLAAFLVFAEAGLDVWVLEVGLGGRLDAVNALDADLALVTNIGLDHQSWLGDTREAIAREKAGILRRARPAVYMDPDPVTALSEQAARDGVDLLCLGVDFRVGFVAGDGQQPGFTIHGPDGERSFALASLFGRHQALNAAGVVALLQHPRSPLAIPDAAVSQGLLLARVPGRFEWFSQEGRAICLDVAHNGEAALALAQALESRGEITAGRRLAVFSALADKPITEILRPLAGLIDEWWITELPETRAASMPELEGALAQAGAGPVHCESDLVGAYNAALAASGHGDEIVVFGSFHVVGPLRARLDPTDTDPDRRAPCA
ncbi:bifunctional folylpolyglutamate synthase/dihydrofolate synthase [Guyparkeria sp. 1SP6A2]|nr:bifunctional folylpolyglutamate synthase/dihydrofolate synthase [Guyparkeria sp. 1SP6A2]